MKLRLLFLLFLSFHLNAQKTCVGFVDSGFNYQLSQINPWVSPEIGFNFDLNITDPRDEIGLGTSVVSKFLQEIDKYSLRDQVEIMMVRTDGDQLVHALEFLIQHQCKFINLSLSFSPKDMKIKKIFDDYRSIIHNNLDILFLNTAGAFQGAFVNLNERKVPIIGTKKYPYHLAQVKSENLIVLGSILEHHIPETNTEFVIKSNFGAGVNLFAIQKQEFLPDQFGNLVLREGGSFLLPEVLAKALYLYSKDNLVPNEIKNKILGSSSIVKAYCGSCQGKVLKVLKFDSSPEKGMIAGSIP